jgi:outer membrane lipoprotein-sorting protein
MNAFRTLILAVLGVSLLPGRGSGADLLGTPLERLESAWSQLQDYSMTVETTEWLHDNVINETVHYAFRKPALARLEVVDGPDRGAVLIWRGGTRVAAYRRGFSLIKIAADVHSRRVTSPRGNGILTPNLGDVLDCFAKEHERVVQTDGPLFEGEPTDAIALLYGDGVSCPDDSPQDSTVTRDILYVSRSSGHILERERYEGHALVERYVVRDLSIDEQLPDSLFR